MHEQNKLRFRKNPTEKNRRNPKNYGKKKKKKENAPVFRVIASLLFLFISLSIKKYESISPTTYIHTRFSFFLSTFFFLFWIFPLEDYDKATTNGSCNDSSKTEQIR